MQIFKKKKNFGKIQLLKTKQQIKPNRGTKQLVLKPEEIIHELEDRIEVIYHDRKYTKM